MLFDRDATFPAIWRSWSPEELAHQLDRMVKDLGISLFCQSAATQLTLLTRPEKALPASLVNFGPMVHDATAFLLARISYQRLREAILSQARLPLSASPAERLRQLALHFPTLHKLAQVIARNPSLDPAVKRWLTGLEQGIYHPRPQELIDELSRHIAHHYPNLDISLQGELLAEASVAAVIGFTVHDDTGGVHSKGVFKMLKPRISTMLEEELAIMGDLFAFLDKNREQYGLMQLQITALFESLRDDLSRELNLAAERHNLTTAASQYGSIAGVRIPRLLPFYSAAMTAMEQLSGIKITDNALPQDTKYRLARLTFETIICMPLFADCDQALFHGDPHAGNILLLQGHSVNQPVIGLVDWTLAGYLSREKRQGIMELLVGLAVEDVDGLATTLHNLSISTTRDATMSHLKRLIRELLASRRNNPNQLQTTFLLLERLTMEGLVFPAELLLFRKSFFTLEGVLHDLAPDFSMQDAMERYLTRLILTEMPQRISTGFLPFFDTPGRYQTLLSNQNLLHLSLSQGIKILDKSWQTTAATMEQQMKAFADLLDQLYKELPNGRK